jgi:hypothetical protein
MDTLHAEALAGHDHLDGPVTLLELYHHLGEMLTGGHDPQSIVVLASDTEGAGFSPLTRWDEDGQAPCVSFAYYRAGGARWGQIWTPGDSDDGASLHSGPEDTKAVVLWPTT